VAQRKSLRDCVSTLAVNTLIYNHSWLSYYGTSDHVEFLNKVFGYFSVSNPLHPDIWPSITKFESEIIAMVANMMNGSGAGTIKYSRLYSDITIMRR